MAYSERIGMKKTKTPMKFEYYPPHPLEPIVLAAFREQGTHDVISLLPYFGAGPDYRQGPGTADYRTVVSETLGHMEKCGVISSDGNGFYSIPRKAARR